MKIAQKLTLFFLIFSLVPLVISGLLVFSSIRFYIIDQAERQLTVFADQKEQQLYQIANNKLEELSIYSNNLNLQILLSSYQTKPNKQDLTEINKLIISEKQKNGDLNDIYILSPNGALIATTHPWSINQDWSTRNFFNESLTKSTATFIKAEGQVVPQLLFSGPITSEGKLVGVVVIDTDASNTLLLTEGAGQLGNTAEAILLNKDGPVTPLKDNVPIDPDSLLADANKLVSDRDRAIYPSTTDYRGKSVIAVTRFIDVFDLSLITKIDRNEVFTPIFEIFIILSTISLIITILAVVASYYLGQSVSQPILALATAASKIEQGDLNTQVKYSGQDEFGILSSTFNNMIDSIRKADQAKSEFISLASHQLRTPLSAIKWTTELLTDISSGQLNQKQINYIHSIQESTRRMTALINSLFDVSRIEGNLIKLKPQDINLRLLIEDVIKDLQPRLAEKKLNLETHLPDLPKTKLDIELISVVYRNLLSNAIKYTPPGGKISLTVSKEIDHILTKISDTGVGISEKDHSKIFKKFFRAKNAVALDPEGSGLGLYLVRTIINSAGGRIWFESKENQGTTFLFTLPLIQ